MSQTAFIDYYRILKVKPSATTEQVREAYIRLAKLQHPDRGGTQRSMRKLNLAYETLRDPSRRRDFDSRYRSYKYGSNNGVESDLDEVDEFLNQVFMEEQRKRWLNPVMICLSTAAALVLLFAVVAVGRMVTSGGANQALGVQTVQREAK